MSFTQGEHLFAGIHEAGVNDLFSAFFTARPRYLVYGTPFFYSATSANATQVPTFLGLNYQLVVGLPLVDIVPGSTGTLTAGPNEFLLKSKVTLTVVNLIGPVPFDFACRCEPVVVNSAPGTGQIGINLKAVEATNISPPAFKPLVEALLLNLMQGVLQNLHIPFNTFTAGAFGLILLDGPRGETDQLKVRGNAL